MSQLTGKQWLSIIVAVLSVLMISTTQLTDLFGQNVAKTLVTVAGLANTIISSVVAALSGQGALINDVRSMPGVERITVNEQANQTLAKIAMDPSADKVAPTPSAANVVQATAEGRIGS